MRFIIAALLIVTGLAVSAQPPSKQSSQERIETNIAPILQITGHPVPTFSIEERLKQLGIPGVSIAVAHKGKIIWQAGYGMADVSQNRKMDTNTLLLAGSISKPVAALRALQLVEDGKIDLDGNINDYSACPDNMQYLSYLAGKTSRIKLATGAVILPWNNPLRVAEKMSMLASAPPVASGRSCGGR